MDSFKNQRCKTLCWVAAALLGLFVIYLLRHYWDVRFIWALLFGLVAFFGLGWLIPMFVCPMNEMEMPVRRMPTPVHVQPKPVTPPTPTPAPVPAPAVSTAVSEKVAAPKATAKKVAKPVAAVKAAKAAPAAKVVKAATPAKVVDVPVAKTAKAPKAKVAVASKVADAPAAPVAKAAAKSNKPEGLTGARGGKPDDLKVIVGVGPGMEKLLNKLGFYHFDQIAAWKAAEVAWVDDNLEGFKGRVTRDKWVAQAKKLAKG